MFLDTERTSGDLEFRLLGVDIRISIWFWLMAAILGWDFLALGFQYLLLWIGCVFLSILVHEFGHVLMGQLFGARGNIILYSFGGLAVGSNAVPYRWQRILVSLAGPAAQFLLLGGVLFMSATLVTNESSVFLKLGLRFLFWINLFWPLFNLLPVWPLDGGQVTKEVLEGFNPSRGAYRAYATSLVVALIIVVNSIAGMNGRPLIPYLPTFSMWGLILFGSLAFNSYQAMQMENERSRWDDQDPWR